MHRQKFKSLSAFCAGDVPLLECRNIESGTLMVVLCITHKWPTELEVVPLA